MRPTQGTLHEVAETRSWSLMASIGSIFSAFIASLCCVGPLVFALLGIGGAGLLVKFEPYRPYFTVATFALLGAGFYFTYRKPAMVGSAAQGPARCTRWHPCPMGLVCPW